MPPIDTVVIRHPKERLSKCSLVPLHGRPDIRFYRATPRFRFDSTGYLLLTPAAPVLSAVDRGRPLLLLDGTWRYAAQLERCLDGDPVRRSLPGSIVTAYPRKSKLFADPDAGLASVEALYAARRILGDDDPALLDGYRWKDAFLRNFE
jgi:pre-rRNA-processing protein TSR3